MKRDLRVHIVPVGFQVNRVTYPLIRERADKVYLITHSGADNAVPHLERILQQLNEQNFLKIEKRSTNLWDLLACLDTYKEIFRLEKDAHVYVNVSTGSKVTAIAGTLACMIWKGTPYYANINYDEKKYSDGLPKETITEIVDIPVYSINKPKPELLALIRILSDHNGTMKKKKMIEALMEDGIIEKELSSSARHSKLKGLLTPISTGTANPLINVEYIGRQSNISLTRQGERTLRIFEELNF